MRKNKNNVVKNKNKDIKEKAGKVEECENVAAVIQKIEDIKNTVWIAY